ncbi:MAG: type II toxin-antitoxin system death-on-curing family toxin, partial [Rhodospirillaceae bacterium]|nr:type II toxin-antitoxin system death-on-curing family toxin [Rhodospirillaceae bacterium]
SASSRKSRSSAGSPWRYWLIASSHYRVAWVDAIRGHDKAVRGGAAPGILNEHNIRSALARPYHGYHHFIHEKAAALVHGIVSSHGFVDGNKRTALYLVELLLRRSGYRLVEDDVAVADTIIAVAAGDIDYEALAQWFRERVVRAEGV